MFNLWKAWGAPAAVVPAWRHPRDVTRAASPPAAASSRSPPAPAASSGCSIA